MHIHQNLKVPLAPKISKGLIKLGQKRRGTLFDDTQTCVSGGARQIWHKRKIELNFYEDSLSS